LNEPANVVGTVAYLAELRGWPVSQAKMRIWQNFTELFARA
jgi:Tat protein secretion system quality control protein TatD with DNase activity